VCLDASWLSVDPSTLDQILTEKFGQLQVGEDGQAAAEIIPHLESFLNRTSDYEGLSPANNSSRKTSRKRSSHLAPPPSSRKVSSMSNASDISQLSNQIGFDPESFGAAMKGILGKLILNILYFINKQTINFFFPFHRTIRFRSAGRRLGFGIEFVWLE